MQPPISLAFFAFPQTPIRIAIRVSLLVRVVTNTLHTSRKALFVL
jgi:hypothetical protein